MKYLLSVCLMLVFYVSDGQTITVEECLQKAEELSPLARQKMYLETQEMLSVKNINVANLPTLNLSGQATYQSDVLTFSDNPLFDAPTIPKDQYKIALDVNQKIYDGGLSKNKKLIEEAKISNEMQSVEVDLYEIKSSILSLYFSSLLLQENIKLLEMLHTELEDQYKIIRSRVQNGLLLVSAADSFKKQILSTEQQILDASLDKEAVLEMLGKWIGQTLGDSIELQTPGPGTLGLIDAQLSLNRPEVKLFESQSNYLETMKKLNDVKRRPVVSAFAQGGFGKPNTFNMLETDWSEFYIVGVKVFWNIWDFGTAKREKAIITTNQEIVKSKQDHFEEQMDRLLDKEKAEIKKLNLLLKKDKEIITLQGNIVRRSFTQLENGVITPQDYLTELNSRTQAELGSKIHEVKLKQAQYNYLNISGNL